MTIAEFLLARKLGNGGGGEITVEGLNVEDNGTYTAPSGKAYSPVVVNLPLGEKAIAANGEYNASADDLKGYSKVTVNVAGFKVKDMPTGAISSFADGTDNPLKELKVSIVPVQSGSGDPSPTNPRAISGWTGANISVTGANIYNSADKASEDSYYLDSTGTPVPNNGYYTSNFIKVKPQTYYYYAINGVPPVSTVNHNAPRIAYYNEQKEYISSSDALATGSSFYIPSNCAFIKVPMYKSSNTYLLAMVTEGIGAPTIYSAFGSVVPISWQTEAGEVFGGELDVTSGILKARPYYASYNGETLVGPWISSLDEYEEGATPTTGAQVVDLGGTETSYQLTPTQVSSILGTNNIWADCGDVISGKYFASL